MAEGFTAADYVTNVGLSEIRGKRLWLVRIPRHIDTARLEGSKVKLPLARKGREGKVLGKAARQGHDDAGSDEEGGGEGGDDLVLRAADAAESHGFRALFSVEEDGRLGAAAPFAGQINVSVETPDLEQIGSEGHAPVAAAALVEPYRGRPQLKGMRIRSKPVGAGSEYTPTRHHNIGDDEPPSTPEADQTQGQGGKRKQPAAERSNRSLPPPETSPGSKKKKRKSSSSAGPEGVGGGEGERELGEDASSAAKKSKKKRKAER